MALKACTQASVQRFALPPDARKLFGCRKDSMPDRCAVEIVLVEEPLQSQQGNPWRIGTVLIDQRFGRPKRNQINDHGPPDDPLAVASRVLQRSSARGRWHRTGPVPAGHWP